MGKGKGNYILYIIIYFIMYIIKKQSYYKNTMFVMVRIEIKL